MLYLIPIEPLEERYTEQWYRWFPEYCRDYDIDYSIIDGITLVDEVQVGTFLDINSTVYYKSEQLKRIAELFHRKKIKKGDIFFVYDIEFWGIEVIKYLSELNGIPVKLYGFLHAASYTKGDFMEPCAPYGKHFENGWLKVFDKVFVGSEYHKNQILKFRECEPDKIVVTGNPYKISEVQSRINVPDKENRVIMTNRPDFEKRPDLTLDVFYDLKALHPDWEFMVTTGRKKWGTGWIRDEALSLADHGVLTIQEGISKDEYFKFLAGSKVMTGNSMEENFGYCILESLVFNTIPIIENKFSHPELVDFDKNLLFDGIPDQMDKIERMMNISEYNVQEYAEKYESSLKYIFRIMLGNHKQIITEPELCREYLKKGWELDIECEKL